MISFLALDLSILGLRGLHVHQEFCETLEPEKMLLSSKSPPQRKSMLILERKWPSQEIQHTLVK